MKMRPIEERVTTATITNACRTASRLRLAWYGSGSVAHRHALMAHVADCPQCQSITAQLNELALKIDPNKLWEGEE
jgi:hypothetical protein